MDKLCIKNLKLAILLSFLSGWNIAWAQVPPNLPGDGLTPNEVQALASAQAQMNKQTGAAAQPAAVPSVSNLPPIDDTPIELAPPTGTMPPILQSSASRRSPVQSPPLSYEESQAIMLNSVPATKASNPDANAAFNALMQQNMPLTPQQVVKLRQLIDISQRAASTPPTIPPKPVSTTIVINLAPGTTPPAIRLAKGYVSSLVFVDSTGAPWPIAAYDIGDPKLVNIQWDGKSNILLMQAANPYIDGNIVIRLVGLMTPLTLELVSGQRVVDFRTDIHVSGLGPNTKDLPAGNGLPPGASPLLLSVLDGIAPPGGKLLTVKGGDCQAWSLGDKMYLRTRLTLLSPGWVGKMVSPDGMYAYELQKSSSVLVSQYGEPIELKIEGF